MDPVLLFLVRFVIVVFFVFMASFVLWVRSVIRERNEYGVIIASLRSELQETEIFPLESDILANSVVTFTLAYYERNRARGRKKVESTTEAMKLCWRSLPTSFQKRLAPLGSLANLKEEDSIFQIQ